MNKIEFRHTTNPGPVRAQELSPTESSQAPSTDALAVLENISDGYIAIDGDWRVRFINKVARQIIGEKLWVGCNFWQAYEHLVGTSVEAAYRRAAAERVPVELEHFNKVSGRWFEIRILPAGAKELSVFFSDISERKHHADQLRDLKLALETQVADLRNLQQLNRLNEERFRMAACGDSITLYEQDENLRYTWLYPAHPEHAGALGRTDAEILPDPEGALLESWKREVMRTGVSQRREITAPLESGHRTYDMSIAARRDHTGRIIGVAGAALDVTARNQALSASRQLAAIVASSQDAIMSEDLNGTVTSWNKSAERTFGYTADEIIGKSISLLIPGRGETEGEQPEFIEKVRRGEGVDCIETLRRHKDGKLLHVSISISPLRNEAQQVIGASKIIRDISERKRQQEQEHAIYELATRVNRAAAMAEIFDAAIDSIMRTQSADRGSILLFDEGGVMRFMSSRGLSDKYQRAVEGHCPWKRDDPDPQPVFIDNIANIVLEEHLRSVIKAEGISALAFIPITYEGKLLGKFMVYYNTPHQFTQAEIRPVQTIATQVAFAIQRQQTERNLERLVDERTASLREAVQQMEEFSYTISHDLRAPLRAMQVYSQALLEDFAESVPPEGIRYIKRLAENSSRLDKMILDVLSFSRIARGNHAMEPVALDKLVREIVQHYPEMHPPAADLTISPLADVIGHEPSLTQVISNLLGNAVKFVPAGVQPKVKVWTENGGAYVTMFVQDNGIGIPQEYQHRLFNMFERIHPELNYEGTGVGLAIVRKAVERMGGKLGVESQPGVGSKFWIQLPAATPTA